MKLRGKEMFRKLLVMGAVVLLAGFAQTAIAAGTGSISGTVVRHADGTPLAGVLVQLVPLWHLNTFTDAAGNYTFTDLPAGTYEAVHIHSQEIGGVRYVRADVWNVEVLEGQNTVVDFSLRKAALIYGYVKTAAGAPIPFAGVSTMIGGGAWSSTDLSGRYELWVAPSPGEFYPITVESALLTGQTYRVYGGNTFISGPDGYNPGAHGYTYLGTATSTHTFFGTYTYYIIVTERNYVALVDTVKGSSGLYYTTHVTGNTLDWGNVGGTPDGAFASVGAEWVGTKWGGREGGFILIQPTLGTTSITVHIVPDGVAGRGPHPVFYENKWDGFHKATAGVPTRVDFSLRQAGAISGRVVDGAGVGIPWASLRGWSEEFGEVAKWAHMDETDETDEAGYFTINHLSPGLNYLDVRMDLHPYYHQVRSISTYRGPISVTSGVTYNIGDLIIVVHEPGKISGTVTDTAGNPINDIWVWIGGKDIYGNRAWGSARTDELGQYTIYVAPGRHHLEFSDEGFVPGFVPRFVPQHVRGIEIGKGEVISINVVLECATKGVCVSGKVIGYTNIAPRDAYGVRLPGEGEYYEFGLPQSIMIAIDMGYPFTDKDFLDLGTLFVGWGDIEDGYTHCFDTCPFESPGRYTMSLLPPGETALGMLVFQIHLPGDGRMCVTFHNWQEFSFSPGEVRNVDFTADTAPTGILKGNIIVPPGYDHFPEGWAIIYAFNEAHYPFNMPLADAMALPGHTPTYKFKNLPAGTYTLKAFTRDLGSVVYTQVTVVAGQTTTKDIAFAPPVEDTLSPTLAITTPAHNERFTTDSITVRGLASDAGQGDSGINRVEVNGLPAAVMVIDGTANWHKTISLSSGANTITVVAFDNSPRQNSTTQTITVYYEPLLPVSARIDDYEVYPQEVTVGSEVTLDLTFTNTSDREHTFGVKAVLRSPNGTRIPLFTAATVLSLAPESVQWTPLLDAPGEWSVAFSIWKQSTEAEHRTLLAQTGWVDIQAREADPEIAARIDRHIVSPTEASRGDTVTIGFTFYNTGRVEHTFGAGATLWQPDGTPRHFLTPVTLDPGESETVEFPPYAVEMIGSWDTVFGVWKGSTEGQLKPLLDRRVGESILVTLGAAHNSPPQAGFTFATDGLRVNFTSTSTDPDNNIVSYHWQFGDGETSGERNPMHTYRGWRGIGGFYEVVHTVTDVYGRTDSVEKQVFVLTRILHVFYPCSIPRGASLRIRVVVTEGGLPLTVTIGDISKTQTSRIFPPRLFSFDITGLSIGEHQLTVEVEGETYASFIDILGGEHLIIGRLSGLERAAESEMWEISRMAAGPLVETIFDELADRAGNVGRGQVGKGLRESRNKFTNHLQKLLKHLPEEDREAAIEGLSKLGGFLTEELVEGLTNFASGAVKGAVAEGTFLIFCSTEMEVIEERTRGVKSEILAQGELSPQQLEEMSRILRLGREAIRNTDEERIYELSIDPVPLLGRVAAEPTLPWFDEQHRQSLDPVHRGEWLWGGVICPIWVVRMMIASGQSLLTIPASIGWIDPAPDDEHLAALEVRPQVVVIGTLKAAVKAYIKLARAVEKFSPWVISAGMFVSTDILACEIKEEHQATMGAIRAILKQGATTASFSRPLFREGELIVPQDDIILTLTPTGKIVDIDFLRGGERLRVPPEYRMVSLGARECFRIAAVEPPQITMQLTSCQETYELGQTARITVTMKNPTGEPLEDLLLWFFVPEEEILERATINLGAHAEVTWSHEFEVTQEMVYAPTAILSFFDTIIAEEVTSFPVGEVQQRRVFMTIDYAEFSNPGVIEMKVKVENIGNIGISPLLTFGGTFGDWTKEFPLLPPQESYLKTVSFDINEPGRYRAYFVLTTEGLELLQARPVDFTVRALDTLLASVSTDQALYHRGDTVQVSVVIEDALFQAVEVPYTLEIITPSGRVITELNFVAEEAGTYIVRATPVAEGHAVVSDETLFIVEKQSDLVIEASLQEKTLSVQITTEAGAPVGGVRVTANNRVSVTDQEGRAKFEYIEVTAPFLRAEKVGFNPAMTTVGEPEPDPVVTDPANGCFIATAAFGTPLAQEIEVLSRLRDRYLLTNELGQRFVAFYERHSPALAEFISEREWAKRLVRVALWPVVRIAELVVD